jgi:dTDP-4-dehydrorhamnose reductase
MRLLVFGASGHLGGELCRQALAGGRDVAGTYLRAPAALEGVDQHRVDIRDPAAVDSLVARVRPEAVVNAASA